MGRKKEINIEEIINIREMEEILINENVSLLIDQNISEESRKELEKEIREELEKELKVEVKNLITDFNYLFIEEMISKEWNDENKLTSLTYLFLLHWKALQRDDIFCFDNLKNWIKEYKDDLNDFRKREIISFDDKKDAERIEKMYECLFPTLTIGKNQYTGASKALHILAPKFFPPWDKKIAKKLCNFGNEKRKKGENYVEFIKRIKGFLEKNNEEIKRLKKEYDKKYGFKEDEKSIVKILDEYLYLTISKGGKNEGT